MVTQFFLALEVVLPLFLLMFVGYCLRRMHLLHDTTLDQLNCLTFALFLPLQLFTSVYNSDLSVLANTRVILFLVVSLVVVFAALLLLIPLIEKDNTKRGVMVQGVIRCNYLIIALPIMASLFSPDQMGIVALIMAVSMPIINPMAIIALELFRKEKGNMSKLIINVMKSPFVISPLLGIVCLLFNFRFFSFIEATVFELGKLGTPLALLLLGAAIKVEKAKKPEFQLIVVLLLKLVVIPLVILIVTRFLGFSEMEVLSLVIFYGTPTAVSTYSLAIKLQGDGQFAQEIVIASTLFSIVSMVGLLVVVQSVFA